MIYIEPPRVPERILPALTKDQIEILIDKADTLRCKAIIALFTEGGLRLSHRGSLRPQEQKGRASAK